MEEGPKEFARTAPDQPPQNPERTPNFQPPTKMRILSIDYGTKRTGIAVTDPMQMIATGLTTLHSKDVVDFIEKYLAKENVETIVIGEPKTLQNTKSDSEVQIVPFINRLKKKFPQLKIERYDERYTSKIAFQSLIDSELFHRLKIHLR